MEYRRLEDGSVVVDVQDGEEVRRGYEVAAWYDRLVLRGGTYPVQPVTIRYTPTTQDKAYYGKVVVPATRVEKYTPSLFGGVAYGKGGRNDTPTEDAYTFAPYWYSVEGRLPHAFEGREGFDGRPRCAVCHTTEDKHIDTEEV